MRLQNNIKELQSVFDGIRHQSADGSEYWNSRELSDALGYSGYWKFRTVIDKAIAVANDKGMKIDDHFNQSVDMVRLGSGSFRKVDAFHLSRLAELFGVDVRTVNYHLKQIFESGELSEGATIRKIGIVQTEGERNVERSPLFYNLDAIITVG